MAFCVIGVVTVHVEAGSVDETREVIGSVSRAFDGTARADIRDIKRTWKFKTTPMSQTDYATLVAATEVSTGPVAITGDLTNSVSTTAYVRITGAKTVGARVSGTWANNLVVCDLEVVEQ